MKESITLKDRAGWQAVAHPLRLAILNLLMDNEMSNEELAKAIGQQSGKLYFHTKKLLDAGLIELTRTRQNGPRVEKLYRRTARQFHIEVGDNSDGPPLARFVETGLDIYQRAFAENPDMLQIGYQMVYSHTPEQNAAFLARLKELMEEFHATADHGTEENVQAINVTVLAHVLD